MDRTGQGGGEGVPGSMTLLSGFCMVVNGIPVMLLCVMLFVPPTN